MRAVSPDLDTQPPSLRSHSRSRCSLTAMQCYYGSADRGTLSIISDGSTMQLSRVWLLKPSMSACLGGAEVTKQAGAALQGWRPPPYA